MSAIDVTLAARTQAQATTIDFERDEAGQPPKGFSFALTGPGKPGAWVVKKDDAGHGNVLAQTDADTTDYRVPVAIYNDVTTNDVDLSVRFKPVAGRGDQGAGLVWRYRDQNNYYITRCNALEDNCTIYRVLNGRRNERQPFRRDVRRPERARRAGRDVQGCWESRALDEGRFGHLLRCFFDYREMKQTHPGPCRICGA